MLEYLLARPGEVVTREEIQTALWQSDTFVDFDHGLNTAINKIREALGDSAGNPRFVETVPRRGYRFIAPVDRPAPVTTDGPTEVENPPRQPIHHPRRLAIGAGVAAAALLAAGFILVPPGHRLRSTTG